MRTLTFFFIFSSFLWTSCSSLQPVSGNVENNENAKEYRFYDENSRIRYQITNNGDYLYIRLNTNHRPTMQNILRGGVLFYFDNEGKKNKETFFNYPLPSGKKGRGKRSDFNDQNRGNSFQNQLEQLPTQAIFSVKGQEQHLELLEKNSEFVAKVTTNPKGNELFYELRVPFASIKQKPEDHLSALSIGILVNSLSPARPPRKDPAAGFSGGRGGGKGMRGGGGGRGHGNMGGGKGNSPKAKVFWTKVELAKN